MADGSDVVDAAQEVAADATHSPLPRPLRLRRAPLKHSAVPPYTAKVLGKNGAQLMRACLERRSHWRLWDRNADEAAEWHVWWNNNGALCPFPRLTAGADCRRRLVCRLPQNRETCTKARLARHMARAPQSGDAEQSLVPETYTLTAKLQIGRDVEIARVAAARAIESGHGAIWIVKPDCRNRGIGITLHTSMDAVLEHVNTVGCVGTTWIVQKYLERPLLVRGRKFDLRAFVLVTPEGDVFLHREPYVRTSSVPFQLADLEDRSIHLTNDAVQTQFDHYGEHEDHNKLSLAELQAALAAEGATLDVLAGLWPQMRAAVRQLFSATRDRLNIGAVAYCFELMGADFMVGADNQVYLIEVNTCPALQLHGRVLADLLPRVVEETFQKAIDPYFPAPPGAAPPSAALDGFERIELDPAPSTLRAADRLAVAVATRPVAAAPAAGGVGGADGSGSLPRLPRSESTSSACVKSPLAAGSCRAAGAYRRWTTTLSSSLRARAAAAQPAAFRA